MNFDKVVVEIFMAGSHQNVVLRKTQFKVAKIEILKDFNKKTSLKSNLTQQNVF